MFIFDPVRKVQAKVYTPFFCLGTRIDLLRVSAGRTSGKPGVPRARHSTLQGRKS